MFNIANSSSIPPPSNNVPKAQPQHYAAPQPLNNEGLNSLNFPVFPEKRTFQPIEGSRFIAHSNQQFEPVDYPQLPHASQSTSYEVPFEEYLEQLKSNLNHSSISIEKIKQVEQYVSGLRKKMESELAQVREERELLSRYSTHANSQTQPPLLWSNATPGDESDEMPSFFQGNQAPQFRPQTLPPIGRGCPQFFDPAGGSDESVPELEAALKELYDKESQPRPIEYSGILNSKKRSAGEAFANPPPPWTEQPLEHAEKSTEKETNYPSFDPQKEHPRPSKRTETDAPHSYSLQGPKIRLGNWTSNEIQFLHDCIKNYGPNWEFISQNCFKGARTPNQCESCFEMKIRPDFPNDNKAFGMSGPLDPKKSEIEPKPGRTPRVNELRSNAKITSKVKIKEWDAQEIEILKSGIETYGQQWELIAKLCFNGKRTATQCEWCYAINIKNDFLDYKEIPLDSSPLPQDNRSKVRMTEWDAQEIEKLLRGIKAYGKDWEFISQHCFNGERTAIQCESYFLFFSERNSESFKKYAGTFEL